MQNNGIKKHKPCAKYHEAPKSFKNMQLIIKYRITTEMKEEAKKYWQLILSERDSNTHIITLRVNYCITKLVVDPSLNNGQFKKFIHSDFPPILEINLLSPFTYLIFQLQIIFVSPEHCNYAISKENCKMEGDPFANL